MLSEEVIDKVVERLVNRIEQGNEYILKTIGESIKKIGTLSPSKAQELSQIIKYGGDYEKIVKRLAEITKLNVKDIYAIFEQVAKSDYQFSKQFYKYRNKKFIPYEKNLELKNQVEALARITAQEYINITNTLAFSKVVNGRTVYTPLARMYQEVLDTAVLNVAQGKETFQSEMYRVLKELGESGIRTVDYPSSRSIRLDSAIRMQMRTALRTLHNENQKIIGEDFGSNMVEVSHHSNSAPDHIDTVDGKQFARIDVIKRQIKSGEEKEIKLSDIKGNKVKVKGKWYYDFDYINNNLVRHVSMLNCYHYTFEGILGISKPAFTEEELQKDKETNLNGFEYENKHYTMYEGEQLLRKIELEIRKAKDEQILGRSSGIIENIEDAQNRITILTHKYKDILKASELPSKLERARVVGYHRVSTKKLK